MVDYEEQILKKTIQINFREINKTKNVDSLIINKLKKYEGKCTKEGYIMPDSTELIERSYGKIRNYDKNSIIEYNINYKIKSILPKINDKYECLIGNISKMGLLCYIKLSDSEIVNSPLLIIVPKEYCDIEKYKKEDKIEVQILDFRIKYMNTQIQLIGKII